MANRWLASTDTKQLTDPKPVGEPVNTHVIPPVSEPAIDYAHINRLISSNPCAPSKKPESSE